MKATALDLFTTNTQDSAFQGCICTEQLDRYAPSITYHVTESPFITQKDAATSHLLFMLEVTHCITSNMGYKEKNIVYKNLNLKDRKNSTSEIRQKVRFIPERTPKTSNRDHLCHCSDFRGCKCPQSVYVLASKTYQLRNYHTSSCFAITGTCKTSLVKAREFDLIISSAQHFVFHAFIFTRTNWIRMHLLSCVM